MVGWLGPSSNDSNVLGELQSYILRDNPRTLTTEDPALMTDN